MIQLYLKPYRQDLCDWIHRDREFVFHTEVFWGADLSLEACRRMLSVWRPSYILVSFYYSVNYAFLLFIVYKHYWLWVYYNGFFRHCCSLYRYTSVISRNVRGHACVICTCNVTIYIITLYLKFIHVHQSVTRLYVLYLYIHFYIIYIYILIWYLFEI